MPREIEYPPCVVSQECETGVRISEALQEAGTPDNLLFLKERCVAMKAILESMGDYVEPSDCPQALLKKYLPEAAFNKEG